MTSQLAVYESLTIVTVEAYEPAKGDRYVISDPPGTANYLCEAYGMASDDFEDSDTTGILWTDYDGPDPEFTVLLRTCEVDAFRSRADDCGYKITGAEEVTTPINYGDGHAGTVAICKHPDGWVILS